MTYVGIDPGKSGALAVIKDSGEVVCIPFSEVGYRALLSSLDCITTVAVVEKVHAFSGQGVTSMFHFGENYGWIQGLLYAYGITYTTVDPRRWKKVFGCTSDKATSISSAKRIFPDIDLRKTPRCRKDHDGKAEALLIADYARRISR